MSKIEEKQDEKTEYKPEAWKALRNDGHVMRGKCPCGADHEMIDRSDKKAKGT